jgi:two-component SAPR family response regulator
MKLIRIFVFLLSIFLFCDKLFAQSYGLSFYGNDVPQDKRTGLDLGAGNEICLNQNFELSFDLSFLPNYVEYFGYVLRVTQNNQSIDLLYDGRPSNINHFIVNFGDKFSQISFDIQKDQLYNKWNTFKLKFDFDKQQLTLLSGKQQISETIPFLQKGKCFRFLFGANSYKNTSIMDVPHMRLKNIKITENKELKYQWKLDEVKGTEAKEEINGNNALAVNPLWVKKQYQDWELVKSFKIKGNVSTAFNKKEDKLYFISSKSLITHTLANTAFKTFSYQSKPLFIPSGTQSFFDERNQKLTAFYLDEFKTIYFDFDKIKWSSNFNSSTPVTLNWHVNKYFSVEDNALFVFGGYGQFKYKNNVYQFDNNLKKWDTLTVKKNEFTPRYLSALAPSLDKKGVYILGGYGSKTGEQVLNPKHLYDLSHFNIQTKEFKKLYNLEGVEEDFVLSNSMVITDDSSFYALSYPINKFNSKLQLIKGSLNNSKWQKLGSTIPFLFYDIKSFVDLYYSKTLNKFVAVTLYHDDNDVTLVEIYTIKSPPVALAESDNQFIKVEKWYYLAGVFLILALILVYYKLYKRKIVVKNKLLKNDNVNQHTDFTFNSNQVLEQVKPILEESKGGLSNTVYLFGNFQLFDNDGHDATKYFTPVLKELFLIILLYTLRWGRGVSSEQLNELIWFDKTEKSARNNRSVNIAKLKTVLDKFKGFSVSKDTGNWTIINENNLLKIDFLNYLNIIKDKNKLDEEKVFQLISIIERGSFLPNTDYEWLDKFKSEISNEIIDVYNHYIKSVNIASDPEFFIRLSDCVFNLDPVNEEAMTIKCKCLSLLGKHSLAKKTLENFAREYARIYGEAYNKDLITLLNDK